MLFLVRFISNVVEDEDSDEGVEPVSPEHAFRRNTRRPPAEDRPRAGGGWMSELMYDPLSSSDNGTAIEMQAESVQKTIEDSLSSAITSIQHVTDSEVANSISVSPPGGQWGIRASREAHDTVSQSTAARGEEVNQDEISDQDMQSPRSVSSNEYNSIVAAELNDEVDVPSPLSSSGLRQRRVTGEAMSIAGIDG